MLRLESHGSAALTAQSQSTLAWTVLLLGSQATSAAALTQASRLAAAGYLLLGLTALGLPLPRSAALHALTMGGVGTMILAVAAGMQPNLTFNPLEPAATITSFIVQVALGDLPHGSVGYQTIFAAGLTLLLITLLFNLLGHWLRRKYREVY